MICRVGTARYRGRAVDLPADLDPERLARAVRSGEVPAGDDGRPRLAVHCRRPAPVHDRVGCITPDTGIRIRTALAAAGRARGLGTPHDPAIRRLEARHERLVPPGEATPDLAETRAALAEASAATDRHQERVAAARGRLQARREADLPADPAAEDLEAAAGELAAAETAAVAARQALDRDRDRARAHRERLAERFRVADALANRRRAARAALVERLAGAYAAAVRAAPGPDPEDPFAADPVTAALAVARVARGTAPVVLAVDRFPDAGAAAAWLGTPVCRVGP